MKVEALGHNVDPCFKAQMGLGIMGPYNCKVDYLYFTLELKNQSYFCNGCIKNYFQI